MLDPMPRQDMRNPPTLSEARLLTRIEGLEELLWAAENDAKEAEAYAGELEAKLVKALEALGEAIYLLDPDEEDIVKETGLHRIVTTYAELTGGKS